MLGGLALALSQAGAYIAETEIPVKLYLELYAEERQNLHDEPGDVDHDTVTVTYRMALKQVEAIPEYGPAAAQIIRICAFLAPDAIPDEIFTSMPYWFEEPLQSLADHAKTWVKVAAAAAQFSLIKRESDPLGFSLHRLVAEVIRDSLSKEERRAMLQAAVNAVNAAFPRPEYGIWDQCARILPHALALVQPIANSELDSLQAALLLNNAAWYLQVRARYREAETLYRANLAMRRRIHGDLVGQVATGLNNLGQLLQEMGQLDEAAKCLEEAVRIVKQLPDTPPKNIAVYLDRLATVYYGQKRHKEAEALSRRALELTESAIGPDHASVSIVLNNLCVVLEALAKFEEAEPLRKRDMAIKAKTLGKQHPEYAISLANLGSMYFQWDKLEQAEGPLRESPALFDAIYRGEHPTCATSRFWLAMWHYRRGELGQARDLCQQAIKIQERFLGPDHRDIVNTRGWLEGVTREIEKKRGK